MTDDRRTLVLRLVLGVLCAYHLGVGLGATLSTDLTLRFGEAFYGLEVGGADPRVVYMLKALGMYAVFTGLLLGAAIVQPARHRAVVGAAALLLAMRAVTRLACFETLHEAFGVSWGHDLFNVALLLGQAGLLVWVLPAEPATPPRPPALGASRRLEAASRRLAAASHRLAGVSTRLRPVFVENGSGERPGRSD